MEELPKFEETRMDPEKNDRQGWPSGPWDDEPDYATWYDEETGLPCLIVRNHIGALCGYVGFPEDHPLHGVPYDAVLWEAGDVHGGLTFSDHCGGHICHVPRRDEGHVWWLGFDCAHSCDFAPR